MGLTFSDHLQPGSSMRREAVKSPRVTTCALPFSKVLVSSGESRFFCWRLCADMMALPPFLALPTGAPCAHCSEGCEDGATFENSASTHFVNENKREETRA